MTTSSHRVRLVLEIDAAEAIAGRIRRDGQWLAFAGWTELGESIVRLAGHTDKEL
ncbi:hypothetical protein [Nocardioides panacisoli]|uniref:Uncharacterized protein n=1 Tax=Nocardioides panacisoli TaxID=627624 RepID=A0ABP7IUS0_9ACTN